MTEIRATDTSMTAASSRPTGSLRQAVPWTVRTWRRFLDSPWLSVVTVIALLLIWQFLVRLYDVPRFLLPAPTDIALQMHTDAALIWMHLRHTLIGIAGGYAAAATFALTLSMLMIRFRVLERMIMPIFITVQTVPKIAIAPLILLWVGAGIESKIMVVAAIAFFPIVINTMAGFKAVDQNLLEVFRSVNATERHIFFRLRVPYALPYIFAGLRIATTLAVLGAVVAEWLAASNGIGFLLLSGSFNFNTARSFAAIIVLAAIGMSFFGLMSVLERRFSWRSDAGRATGGV